MRFSALILAATLVGVSAPAFAQNFALPVGNIPAPLPDTGYSYATGGFFHDAPVYQGRSVAVQPAPAHVVHHAHRS